VGGRERWRNGDKIEWKKEAKEAGRTLKGERRRDRKHLIPAASRQISNTGIL